MNETERWLPVPGYEERYEVSDRGRVRSLMDGNNRGRFPRPEPLVLSPHVDRHGYDKPGLRDANGRRRYWFAHRLVLLAFRGPPQDGQCGMHLNGDRLDNRLENLEWGTPKENIAMMRAHGTRAQSVRRRRATVAQATPEQRAEWERRRVESRRRTAPLRGRW